ncbi:MAG: glycosyltransferase family 2 protein [Candidatus Nealsonbacteria bacterium]
MIEVNKEKIKKVDIVIGIPSYNEADNIARVVEQIDKGLVKYFSNKSAVIINTDNNSSDKTKDIFLSVKTKTPKIYISTPKRIKGKGNNLKNLFLIIRRLKAKAGATVDADLKSINSEWIKCLIGPILNGYDYLTPIYNRHKYDATITNNLCFPTIYGLLGYNIRQPIGGDMGFSGKIVKYWLSQKWPESTKYFGIDIFMTLNAIKSKVKIGQVDLGAKIHKPSIPKLNDMFLQVVDTLFLFLSNNKDLWNKKIKTIKKPKLVLKVKSKFKYPEVVFNNKINKKTLIIDKDLWAQIVYDYFLDYLKSNNKKKIIKSLRKFYFDRTISFFKEVLDKNDKQAEKLIQEQAQEFYKTRDYLLEHQKNKE